jgi:urea transport system substrate-binding protein
MTLQDPRSTATGIGRRGALQFGAALAAAAALPSWAQAGGKPFKIGLFIPISGPASLFAATDRACADLAVEQINKAGGILGRPIQLVVVDAGGPPADSAKSAVRLMLEEQVDLMVGSHDSATRQTLIGTIKGKVPYIYTPVYEGGECAPNTYVLADTPQQQIKPSLEWLMTQGPKAKKVFMVGNDYVWPRKCNEFAKGVIAAQGGTVLGEEYLPLGAANKFEEVVGRIKAAKPDLVISTCVGGDNINFNRTFASFGLSKDISRVSYLLEENTLAGIGAESSENLYSCMSYFASIDSEANKQFKAAYFAKFGDKAPPLSLLGVDCYNGVVAAKALVTAAKGTGAAAMMAASQGLHFDAVPAPMTMSQQHVDKTMYLALCKGTTFQVIQTFADVKHGQTCKTA